MIEGGGGGGGGSLLSFSRYLRYLENDNRVLPPSNLINISLIFFLDENLHSEKIKHLFLFSKTNTVWLDDRRWGVTVVIFKISKIS